MLHGTAIHPQFNRLVDSGHGDVDAPVVVKVGKGDATMQARRSEVGAGIRGDVSESSSLITEHSIWLRLVDVESTACHKYIEPAVVIEVDEPASPAVPWPAQVKQATTCACVLKGSLAVIPEQLKGL